MSFIWIYLWTCEIIDWTTKFLLSTKICLFHGWRVRGTPTHQHFSKSCFSSNLVEVSEIFRDVYSTWTCINFVWCNNEHRQIIYKTFTIQTKAGGSVWRTLPKYVVHCALRFRQIMRSKMCNFQNEAKKCGMKFISWVNGLKKEEILVCFYPWWLVLGQNFLVLSVSQKPTFQLKQKYFVYNFWVLSWTE